MVFKNYKEMVNYLSKSEKNKNIKLFLKGYYLNVRDLNNNLICNYDLRFINFIMLESDLSKILKLKYEDLNYNFKL